MYFIIGAQPISEIVKYKWDCDDYGNISETENTQNIFSALENNIDPLYLCKDSGGFRDVCDFYKIFYKDRKLYTYKIPDNKFYRVFPKCWHNFEQFHVSHKYDAWYEEESRRSIKNGK